MNSWARPRPIYPLFVGPKITIVLPHLFPVVSIIVSSHLFAASSSDSCNPTMKLSLKFQPRDQHSTQLMTAKVPLTIFNHPFMSAISASTTSNSNTNSDFTFSLSTNFPSGPSLKLSYFPTTTTTASTSSTSSSSIPLSLSLKSGLGLLGSPRNSPLVFSANFTLSPSLIPTASFFLNLKPQFGHFSLIKTVSSDPNTKPYSLTSSLQNYNSNNNNSGEFFNGFASDGSSSGWKELKLEPFGGRENTHMENNIGFVPGSSLVGINNEKRGLSPGVAVMARTVLPVTKGLLLNSRWGVNLPWDSGVKMPFLTVNKIGLERVVEDVKQNKKQGNETSERDLQLLKGICFCMKRDLEVVEKENREMKRLFDEMRMGVSTSRNYRDESNGGGVGRKLSSQQHSGEVSSEFERWRNKKSFREENEKKEQPKKQQQQSVVSDVESELQKAIKAAASASS